VTLAAQELSTGTCVSTTAKDTKRVLAERGWLSSQCPLLTATTLKTWHSWWRAGRPKQPFRLRSRLPWAGRLRCSGSGSTEIQIARHTRHWLPQPEC